MQLQPLGCKVRLISSREDGTFGVRISGWHNYLSVCQVLWFLRHMKSNSYSHELLEIMFATKTSWLYGTFNFVPARWNVWVSTLRMIQFFMCLSSVIISTSRDINDYWHALLETRFITTTYKNLLAVRYVPFRPGKMKRLGFNSSI